jgi:parvulin-like peptidyl-prolyl isomerase
MTQCRMVAVAAAVVVATAVAPALAEQAGRDAAAPQAPGATTQRGEQLSDMTVQKVGKALRQAATIRQQYTDRAQSKPPQQQEQLTEQAQGEMIKAINDQGLSVQQYNQVIQMAQADPTLKQRLLSVAQSGE